jgi:hypothetical protein
MTTRRSFLGTLAKAIGAGGLLLPWAGKGALALPVGLGEAAQLPVTAAPLPFSAECLHLREIKRALAALPNVYDGRWGRMMASEYRPASERLRARPVRSWTDCVELAETIWAFWGKDTRDWDGLDRPTDKLSAKPLNIDAAPVVALVEGVLALGGGERFDPRTAWWDRGDAT